MKRNIGDIDRTVRLIAALVLAGLYFGRIITAAGAIIVVIVSIILFLTATVAYCPLYSLLGINTCSPDRNVKP